MVIGVINGVMMQETFKVAAQDDTIILKQKKRAARLMSGKMAKLFQALDESGDGNLSIEEFRLVADDPDVKLWLDAQDIDTANLDAVFNFIDTDKDLTVNCTEFTKGLMRLKKPASTLDIFL